MTTLYFAFFCVGIFLIIVWAFKNDDHEEFNGGGKDKRFSMDKAKAMNKNMPK